MKGNQTNLSGVRRFLRATVPYFLVSFMQIFCVNAVFFVKTKEKTGGDKMFPRHQQLLFLPQELTCFTLRPHSLPDQIQNLICFFIMNRVSLFLLSPRLAGETQCGFLNPLLRKHINIQFQHFYNKYNRNKKLNPNM